MMKRERVDDAAAALQQKQKQIKKFYSIFFHHVKDTLLYRLATHNGRFRLWQREICPRQDLRNYVFYETQQVFDVIAFKVYDMTALQFGPIFPMTHYLKPSADSVNTYDPRMQPISAPPLDNLEMNLDTAKPRQYERKCFKEGLLQPQGEVVIDVDMDPDFHDRSLMCDCGKQRKVCDICWSIFMDSALLVLNYMLDFCELKARFTVFSGRRGFHIWILDKRSFEWSSEQRASFIDRLQRPVPGSAMYKGAKQLLQPLYEKYKSKLVVPEGVDAKEACMVLFPCMDRAVTADATHLHKLPLTLHPESLNLCVVFDSASEKFIPSQHTISAQQVTKQIIQASESVILRALDNL
ncbi:MAG: hypothetical protein K2Q45_02440 [Nitrosomonas sp.]|nr:hypothetical protein [Nitrosomonas sp.]